MAQFGSLWTIYIDYLLHTLTRIERCMCVYTKITLDSYRIVMNLPSQFVN